MMRKLILAATLFLLAFGAQNAAAQFLSCTATASPMNLGNYTGAQVTAGTSTVAVTCVLTTSDTISLNQGAGAGATTTTRKMTRPGGATLSYQIFQNSTLTTNWGNTTGVDIVTGTGTQTLLAYPRVLEDQYVIPGVYTDTVTVTVNYSFIIPIGSYNTTMAVTATVLPNCTISSTNLAFGNYSGALINSTSTISVTCTNTTPYSVGLNAGTGNSATDINRKMTGPGGATLSYALYSNAARTSNWGSNPGVSTVAGTGTGAAQTLTVYGQLPVGLPPTPGNYTDTIVATITY
jgi:spore coat protein U-like protein